MQLEQESAIRKSVKVLVQGLLLKNLVSLSAFRICYDDFTEDEVDYIETQLNQTCRFPIHNLPLAFIAKRRGDNDRGDKLYYEALMHFEDSFIFAKDGAASDLLGTRLTDPATFKQHIDYYREAMRYGNYYVSYRIADLIKKGYEPEDEDFIAAGIENPGGNRYTKLVPFIYACFRNCHEIITKKNCFDALEVIIRRGLDLTGFSTLVAIYMSLQEGSDYFRRLAFNVWSGCASHELKRKFIEPLLLEFIRQVEEPKKLQNSLYSFFRINSVPDFMKFILKQAEVRKHPLSVYFKFKRLLVEGDISAAFCIYRDEISNYCDRLSSEDYFVLGNFLLDASKHTNSQERDRVEALMLLCRSYQLEKNVRTKHDTKRFIIKVLSDEVQTTQLTNDDEKIFAEFLAQQDKVQKNIKKACAEMRARFEGFIFAYEKMSPSIISLINLTGIKKEIEGNLDLLNTIVANLKQGKMLEEQLKDPIIKQGIRQFPLLKDFIDLVLDVRQQQNGRFYKLCGLRLVYRDLSQKTGINSFLSFFSKKPDENIRLLNSLIDSVIEGKTVGELLQEPQIDSAVKNFPLLNDFIATQSLTRPASALPMSPAAHVSAVPIIDLSVTSPANILATARLFSPPAASIQQELSMTNFYNELELLHPPKNDNLSLTTEIEEKIAEPRTSI